MKCKGIFKLEVGVGIHGTLLGFVSKNNNKSDISELAMPINKNEAEHYYLPEKGKKQRAGGGVV